MVQIDISSKPSNTRMSPSLMGWMTQSILAVCCCLLFFVRMWSEYHPVPEAYKEAYLVTSPIYQTMLYDYPSYYELLSEYFSLYGFEENASHPSHTKEAEKILEKISHTSFWPGYYQLFLKGSKKGFSDYPTFEKIKQGQVWRLFTPIFLHGDIFHLLFNMLWLIVLGKQIEKRLSWARYALFILIVTAISNTAEYLMSGSNFIGFSGVLCGMLAFVWVRQKKAPWEGYQLERNTVFFMLLFVFGIAALQIVSFVLETTLHWSSSPNIANMAHIVGGGAGYGLGYLRFFKA